MTTASRFAARGPRNAATNPSAWSPTRRGWRLARGRPTQHTPARCGGGPARDLQCCRNCSSCQGGNMKSLLIILAVCCVGLTGSFSAAQAAGEHCAWVNSDDGSRWGTCSRDSDGSLYCESCPPGSACSVVSCFARNDALTGSWHGTYGYSDARPPVRFLFQANIAGNVIRGRISEPNTFGTPGVPYLFANVYGTISGDTIQFTKTYDGTGGQSHAVQYYGRINRASKQITGSWSLSGASGSFTMSLEG